MKLVLKRTCWGRMMNILFPPLNADGIQVDLPIAFGTAPSCLLQTPEVVGLRVAKAGSRCCQLNLLPLPHAGIGFSPPETSWLLYCSSSDDFCLSTACGVDPMHNFWCCFPHGFSLVLNLSWK